MYFLVACQYAMTLVMALTPAQRNAMVVSRNPNQRYANELSNRSSRDPPTPLLDYANSKGTRRRALESSQEEIPAEVQRSISMTQEALLIERPKASSSFDNRTKKSEITTADTIFTNTDDRGSRFFVNQALEHAGYEKSVTKNGKELQTEAMSLKKRATGNTAEESSSRKETTEILSRKIDVVSSSSTDLKDKDEIAVSENSQEFENTFVTPLPAPEESFPSIVNEISNHRYEAAVPIIKSTPLNHRPDSVNVEKAEFSPSRLEHSVYIGVTPDSSHSEELAYDTYSRISNSRYAGKYTYGYRVTDHETGNDFGHEEHRHGDITKGRYHVLLPDGRIQNVNYHVDHDGYHAKVSYH
ncbi:uncharacterized protein LOC117171568 [Belonocnema kinseyi]|uniref:uncharacterized protein LOC117171568 n=1 Tax=Belonocnema kinseyi TaxID=2817044 RepID=UPI00143DAB56|nr:uncharacterized protein LOC117171568 [Belonocnema kinseyi]